MTKDLVPPLVCRTCGGRLVGNPGGLACPQGHQIPVVAGIPDCRPPLVGFDLDADRRLAELLQSSTNASFEELLRQYWRAQSAVPEPLAERFIRGDVIGADRAKEVAEQINAMIPQAIGADSVVLEVGCGTAALASVVARRAGAVVASDVSLAWLVLARRRLQEAGLDRVMVIAATADYLPFRDDTFDVVLGADVIEHVPDPVALARDCYRVIRPSGALWLSTPNRLSLTPEPHVRVWGVGWLPRRLGRRLVRRVRGVAYDDVRTLSLPALRRTLTQTGGRVYVEAPAIAGPVRAGYGSTGRALIDAYHLARRLPIARHAILGITPLFHALVVKTRGVDAP